MLQEAHSYGNNHGPATPVKKIWELVSEVTSLTHVNGSVMGCSHCGPFFWLPGCWLWVRGREDQVAGEFCSATGRRRTGTSCMNNPTYSQEGLWLWFSLYSEEIARVMSSGWCKSLWLARIHISSGILTTHLSFRYFFWLHCTGEEAGSEVKILEKSRI